MGKSNLVITGGGFAGTALARRMEQRLPEDWQVILLSQDNCITYNPLYQAARSDTHRGIPKRAKV